MTHDFCLLDVGSMTNQFFFLGISLLCGNFYDYNLCISIAVIIGHNGISNQVKIVVKANDKQCSINTYCGKHSLFYGFSLTFLDINLKKRETLSFVLAVPGQFLNKQ